MNYWIFVAAPQMNDDESYTARRIERVAGLHVDEVRPPAEDLQRAQLAALLDNR